MPEGVPSDPRGPRNSAAAGRKRNIATLRSTTLARSVVTTVTYLNEPEASMKIHPKAAAHHGFAADRQGKRPQPLRLAQGTA
jgi:hypothetical protein